MECESSGRREGQPSSWEAPAWPMEEGCWDPSVVRRGFGKGSCESVRSRDPVVIPAVARSLWIVLLRSRWEPRRLGRHGRRAFRGQPAWVSGRSPPLLHYRRSRDSVRETAVKTSHVRTRCSASVSWVPAGTSTKRSITSAPRHTAMRLSSNSAWNSALQACRRHLLGSSLGFHRERS